MSAAAAPRIFSRRHLLALGAALCAFALLWLAVGRGFGSLDELWGDWQWRQIARSEAEHRIVLIDIDEASLGRLGPWPWPRERLADLSRRLASEGAALQIFDLVLPGEMPGDGRLVTELQRNSALLGQVFALEENSAAAAGVRAGALDWAACPPSLPLSRGYIANAAPYAAIPVGHISPIVEADGVIRRQPALVCDEAKVYPALFLVAINQALAAGSPQLERGTGLLAPAWRLSGASLNQKGLPLDALSNVRIPWRSSPQAFTSIAAADVLAGRVPEGLLKNAWVLVGSSALGLNDRVVTPLGGSAAGMLVHAQLLQGVLDNALPVEPEAGWLWSVVFALLGVLLLAGVASRPKWPVFALPLSALLVAALFVTIKWLALLHFHLWLPLAMPLTFVLLFGAAASLVNYAANRFERDRLFRHLSSYLPGPVAAMLASQDPSDAIDATRRNITVLFADIRNFSAYCEMRPPEESTAVLHAFFSMVTRQVENRGGVVESFQGDAVLAVWGSGDDGPDPDAALQAALAILREGSALLPATEQHDLAPLGLGIGLETGMATVGSFGLARRRTHLAMGHTVTTAARLQEMTVELAHPILVGEGMAALVEGHALKSQGMFLLDGLKAPCHIYAYPLSGCLD